MTTPDCEFTPPVVSDCPPSEVVPVDPVAGPPLIRIPCIPSIGGEVKVVVTGNGTLQSEGSSSLKIIRNPASECGFSLVGSINLVGTPFPAAPCIIDADAYEGIVTPNPANPTITVPAVIWYNRGGIRTTLNDVNVPIEGWVLNDPNTNYHFKFWKCHAINEPPDRTRDILHPGSGAGMPGHVHTCETSMQADTVNLKSISFSCIGDLASGWTPVDGITLGGGQYLTVVTPNFQAQLFDEVLSITNNLSGDGAHLRPDEVRVSNATGSSSLDITSLNIQQGSSTILIQLQVDRDIRFREIDVCENGTERKMLVLASEIYGGE